MTKDLTTALKVNDELIVHRSQLRNHKIIANSNLPKQKQKRFDDLVTKCLVNVRNTESKLAKLFEKLDQSDKRVFSLKYRLSNG